MHEYSLDNLLNLEDLLKYLKVEAEAKEVGKIFFGKFYKIYLKEKINEVGSWDNYNLLLEEAPLVRGDHLMTLINGFLDNQDVVIENQEFKAKDFSDSFYDLVKEYEEKVLNF